MSAYHVLLGAGGIVMGVGGLLLLPRIWSGWFGQTATRSRGTLQTRGDRAFVWWPFGDASRRGAIRGLVAVIAAWWGGLLMITAMEVSLNSHGTVSHAARITGLTFAALTGLAFLAAVTVMFFNWPKFIVPPSQRGERGILAQRLGR